MKLDLNVLSQGIITGAKAIQGNRKADAKLGGLENNKDGVFAGSEFLNDFIGDHHFSDAADFAAFHKLGMPHVCIVNF